MNGFASVITSTYNKDKYLDLTLAGFALQTDRQFEIVIVDDGSEDNTENVIDKYADKLTIQYFKQQKNSGISVARNLALKKANGDYIIVTDDDRIPCPDFVAEHKKALRGGKAIVSIGKQGRVLSFYSNRIPLAFDEWIRLFSNHRHLLDALTDVQLFTADELMANFNACIERFELNPYDPSGLHPIADKYGENLEGYHFGWCQAYGGNIAFDRTKLTSDIYYDEAFQGYGAEDVDFAYQLYLQNFHFRFTKGALNYHQEHARNPRERQQQFRNIEYLLNKYDDLEMHLLKWNVYGVADLEMINFFLDRLKTDAPVIETKIKNYFSRLRGE